MKAALRRRGFKILEKNASTFGLGDAAKMAEAIEEKKKASLKYFKNSPLKGVIKPATVQKRVKKRMDREQAIQDGIFNPKIKGLQGAEGVITEEDGTVRLQDLKRMRPDIWEMVYVKPEKFGFNVADFYRDKEKLIARERAKRNEADDYRPTSSRRLSPQTKG